MNNGRRASDDPPTLRDHLDGRVESGHPRAPDARACTDKSKFMVKAWLVSTYGRAFRPQVKLGIRAESDPKRSSNLKSGRLASGQ